MASIPGCGSGQRAISAELGADRVAMWGISGGGPHVLACAALLPDLVVAAASLASLAPYGAAGLDWYAGMGQDNVDDFRLYFADREAARQKTAKDREEALAETPEGVAKGLQTLLTPTDAAVLTGELAEYLVWSTKQGLAPGDEGWWEDAGAHAGPWASSWTRYRSRCCCCTAGRTCSCRSGTVSGWPGTSPG